MKIHSICFLSLFLLASCGGDKSPTSATEQKPAGDKKAIVQTSSKLDKYFSEENICEVISKDEIKQIFQTDKEIKTTASAFMNTPTCEYSWDRADMAEREKNYLKNFSNQEISMRQKVMNHSFTVALSETKRTAQNFVPPKLTDAQLQNQIDRAKKAAEDRLSDEQKEIAGDAASSMIENMLKKNNQNQEVANVGDAAYWSQVGHGSLNVLAGNLKLVVTPMIADSQEEDIINASEISRAILK